MKLSVLEKYLPWKYLSDYRARKEYDRYQRWLKDNYREPLRPKRRDEEIIHTGVDFMTNAPKLTLLRKPSVGNPYKKSHV